jgi:hypothetical protein
MANALAGLLIIGELLIKIGVYILKDASVIILATILPIIKTIGMLGHRYL